MGQPRAVDLKISSEQGAAGCHLTGICGASGIRAHGAGVTFPATPGEGFASEQSLEKETPMSWDGVGNVSSPLPVAVPPLSRFPPI